MKTITELKKTVLLSKKESKELSQAYAAILKQVEAQTVGVKNAETDELKLIIKACSKELKEQEQSKTSGAPYSEQTIELCKLFLNDLKPKTLSEQETIDAINIFGLSVRYGKKSPPIFFDLKQLGLWVNEDNSRIFVQ